MKCNECNKHSERHPLAEDMMKVNAFMYASPNCLGVFGSDSDVNCLLLSIIYYLLDKGANLDFFLYHVRKEIKHREKQNHDTKRFKI